MKFLVLLTSLCLSLSTFSHCGSCGSSSEKMMKKEKSHSDHGHSHDHGHEHEGEKKHGHDHSDKKEGDKSSHRRDLKKQ